MNNNTLISYNNLKTLLSCPHPNEKATIITDILRQTLLIVNNDLYTLNQNMTYTKSQTEVKLKIQTTTTKLIEESYKNLSLADQGDIKESKHYRSLFSNRSAVLEIYPQIYSNLIKDDVIFDHTINEIHFNNGYFDINSQSLKPRVLHHHYITKIIERDYIPSTKDQQDEILGHIYKVYPKADFKIILSVLGSALTGLSSRDQELLFILGKGSSGKSMTMQLCKACISCYYHELQSNTFTINNPKIDKIMNTYISNPQIRITCINELEDKKTDNSLFKTFCDGNLTTTELYKDGQREISHMSKPIFTLNTMLNINLDSGVSRRINGYTCSALFTDDKRLVDESKRIYQMDKDIIKKISEKYNLLNAFFDLMAAAGKKWLDGEKIVFNSNFSDTKSSIILANDIFQDFIDSKLTITNSPSDRIGKNEMFIKFNQMYPTKHLSVIQLITNLKEKEIKYSQKERCNKIQGCFSFVKFADDDFIDDNTKPKSNHRSQIELDNGIFEDDDNDINYKEKYLELLEQYNKLIKLKINI